MGYQTYWLLQCRYLVAGRSMTFPQYVDLLRPEYAMYKLPLFALPFWVRALQPYMSHMHTFCSFCACHCR